MEYLGLVIIHNHQLPFFDEYHMFPGPLLAL